MEKQQKLVSLPARVADGHDILEANRIENDVSVPFHLKEECPISNGDDALLPLRAEEPSTE